MPTPTGGYHVNGKRVPSVSTILGNLGWGQEQLIRWAANLGLNGLDYEKERDRAATIGTVAHELITAHLLNRLPNLDGYPFDLIELARPCLSAYQDWACSHHVELLESEFPLVSSALMFGGTPDAVIRMNRTEIVLVDFKSSNWLSGKHIIQVAAYLDLIAECRGKELNKAIIIKVGKDGVFKTLTVEGETITQAREAFYHLLQIHKLKSPLEKLTRAVNIPGAIPQSAELTMMGTPV
jgi:hypothetical protein